MRKIVIAVCVMGALFMLVARSGHSSAMTDTGPNGTKTGGVFKDSFTVNFAHGIQGCGGAGTYFKYTYVATTDGIHQYQFYSDAQDNPYVMLDATNVYTPLDTTCGTSVHTSGSNHPGLTLVDQFSATIDNQLPTASITTPSGTVSTSSSSYEASGVASDPEGNLSSVKAMVNGVLGSAATLSGNTFKISVPLKSGANTIQMVASDLVGHTGTSNTVTINDTAGAAAGGSGSSGTSTGSSGAASVGQTSASSPSASSGAHSGSSTSTTASPASQAGGSASSPAPIVKFGQEQVLSLTDPYANDSSSKAVTVQDTLSIAGATGKAYDLLIIAIVLLVGLCALVIFRFRPIFAKLDKEKSGLRRRIIVIVTLPSLLPLLGLGLLAYQQLSLSVKNSLSSQLEKAAQTSSLKLSREFSIRELVITKTASDILQIKSQYQTQQQQLAKQQSSCQQIVQADIPKKQFGNVTSNSDCLPFLTGFAQLASSASATLGDYQNALTQGAAQASRTLSDQEGQRVDELLGSVRDYFPDVLELDIVGTSGSVPLEAVLPRIDSTHATISQAHSNLLSLAVNDNLALLDSNNRDEELYVTYPIISGGKKLGGVVAALDMRNPDFVPSIWNSTPKPYDTDQTYFITSSGQLIAPASSDTLHSSQIAALAKNSPAHVYTLKAGSQTLATRTSQVGNTNWMVAVGAPASSVLAPLAGIQRTALLAIAGFILLSLLLGLWFVSGVAGEIEALLQGALAFAKGHLDFKINLKHRDELQTLGDTMNQMAEDIKSAQAALVEKDKEFINVATHELRTPLAILEANLSTALLPGFADIPPKAKPLIQQAYNDTQRLRELINDMLDIARLEAGHVAFESEPVDIAEIGKAVVDMNNVPAQQAGVALVYAPPAMPTVMADKSKLQIILSNFVSNALKYNKPGGSVTISHTVEGDLLVTSIADTGLGIPEDQQAHIFEKFFRVQHADRSSVPGTGLGMYITKQYVEAMGGTVSFTSVHGRGTTFKFSLPVKPSGNVPPAPRINQMAAPGTIFKPTA